MIILTPEADSVYNKQMNTFHNGLKQYCELSNKGLLDKTLSYKTTINENNKMEVKYNGNKKAERIT